jgi:L-threonylcarbamoyladenylate synthase
MKEEILKTVEYLKKGKIILYPTDTIWGIGCNATNYQAVEKVYAIKRRVESKSLIILVDSFDKIKQYINKVPLIADDLINSINTPLTIIYPNAKKLAKNVIARDGTIAIRVVKDEFCQQVIKEFGKPVVSSSANVSGEPNPIIFSKISDDILNSVDYVVNVHRDRVKETKPSQIIKLEENGEFKVIRK